LPIDLSGKAAALLVALVVIVDQVIRLETFGALEVAQVQARLAQLHTVTPLQGVLHHV